MLIYSGAQIQGAQDSRGELSILLICLTFVDGQDGTCFMPPFGSQNFEVVLEHLDNLCALVLKQIIEVTIQRYIMPLQISTKAT